MSNSMHEQMHAQHRQWQGDLDSWRADLDLWKKELNAATTDLDTVNSAVRDMVLAIDSHADAIWEHQQRLNAHECIVGQEAREATDSDWANTHEAQAAGHARLDDAHRRIKHHQHSVVSEVKRLLRKMLEAM